MLVSVCIPTYNRPGLVREAVESALAQTYRPIEVVVSDDSPGDETERGLADFVATGVVRYVRNRPSLRQAGNVNRLFDLARGELLVLLHDDDLLLPTAVSDLMKCFEAAPGITAAYGKQYLMSADGAVDEAASASLNADYRRTSERAGRQPSALVAAITAQFPNDGYLVRADVAKAIRYRGGPAVGDACDLDFGLRLASAADGFFFLDRYTAKYRVTGQSVSAGNNYTNVTFDLLAELKAPPDCEMARQEQLRRFARPAVNRWLAIGDRRAALRVYRSAAYGWRRRLSVGGLIHAALLLCPAGLTKRLLARARTCRTR